MSHLHITHRISISHQFIKDSLGINRHLTVVPHSHTHTLAVNSCQWKPWHKWTDTEFRCPASSWYWQTVSVCRRGEEAGQTDHSVGVGSRLGEQNRAILKHISVRSLDAVWAVVYVPAAFLAYNNIITDQDRFMELGEYYRKNPYAHSRVCFLVLNTTDQIVQVYNKERMQSIPVTRRSSYIVKTHHGQDRITYILKRC